MVAFLWQGLVFLFPFFLYCLNIYIYILIIQHAAKFTVTDEEVYCVCYPTDVKPAFRRTDQTCHLIFLCSFSLRDNDVWISEIFSYISSISAYVLSGGHLYSGAPPTQVDVDVEVAEANWYIYIYFKLLYGSTYCLIQKSTVLTVISTYCHLKCYQKTVGLYAHAKAQGKWIFSKLDMCMLFFVTERN